jgi:NitT/TauT family transport system permease protein
LGRRVLLFIISLSVILVVWYFYAINTNPIIFATPQSVALALVDLFTHQNFTTALLSMLWLLFLGFGLCVATGIPLGLIMGTVKLADDVLDPYFTALYVVPRVALVPLFIIWLGFGVLTSVLFVYTFAFFPVILTVAQGAKNTDKIFIDVARVGRARRSQIFSKVIIPYSLPYIFAGLRIGFSLAYIGVVIAQLDLVITGVGAFLARAQEFYRTDEVLAILIVLAVVGYLLSVFFKLLERRLTHGLRFSKLAGMQ